MIHLLTYGCAQSINIVSNVKEVKSAVKIVKYYTNDFYFRKLQILYRDI